MKLVVVLLASFIILSLFVFSILLLLVGIFKYAGFLDKVRKDQVSGLRLAGSAVRYVFGQGLGEEISLPKLLKLSFLSTFGLYLVLGIYFILIRVPS